MEFLSPRYAANAKLYFVRVRDKNRKLSKSGAMMLALLDYLENEVELPPRQIGAKGLVEMVIFGEDSTTVAILINTNPRAMDENILYEIKYALQPPWTYAFGYAASVEVAAQMIAYGLLHANQ